MQDDNVLNRLQKVKDSQKAVEDYFNQNPMPFLSKAY